MEKNSRARLFILLCAAGHMLVPLRTYAYEVDTHTEMSLRAARQSNLERILPSLGFVSLRDRVTDIETTRSIEDWIGRGAEDEDDTISANFFRYRHHFFDPQNGGRGLSATATGEPSPDWALEDTRTFITQSFSFNEARQYFYDALTLPNQNREQWMARTFYTLGHVIHHIQDMAQPQHTRNDSHGGGPFGSPSRFEKHTDLDTVRQNLLFSDANYNVNKPVAFENARKFWIDDGRGMAEFSSHNFVSFGTNFRGAFQNGQLIAQRNERYPLPVPNPVTPNFEDANALLASVNRSAPPECGAEPCVIAFYSSEVSDNYRPEASGTNSRASAASIFDQDLQRFGTSVTYPNLDRCSDPNNPATCEQIETDQVFSLNSFNFDEAHKFLIPRAVAYSAGLIDYFFRGRLEAEDVEFTDTGIRLRVKNAIDPQEVPALKDEILHARTSAGSAGTFVVAYEYRDASSATRYGASPPVTATGGDLAPGQISSNSYNFTISIPVDASDVKYRLVFRGRLGQEDDAVAVGPVEPVSGFLVSPNYVPSDGIAGKRMISTNAGHWRLTDQQGLVAGEVDWKGWYVGDRPTKLLSWHGPNSRYFPFLSGGEPFRQQVYQNGEVFAIAPHRVLGAALLKGADGAEWLVAICHDGADDVAYRRPATKSDSPALFDPVAEPTGWVEIGRLAGQPYLQTDRPWFFNSSGTAAQTLRGVRKTGDEVNIFGTKLARLKATISVDHVSFESTDNLGPIVTRGSFVPEKSIEITTVGDFTTSIFTGGRTSQSTETGEYIVAVDYKKDEPVECRVIVNNTRTSHLRATETNVSCSRNCTQDKIQQGRSEAHFVESNESVRSEKVRCGAEEVAIDGDKQKLVIDVRRNSGSGPHEGTREVVGAELNGAIVAADLRHNLVASVTFDSNSSLSDVVTGRFPLRHDPCSRLFSSDGHASALVRRRLDEVKFSGSRIIAGDRTDTLLEERDLTSAIWIYNARDLANPDNDCFPFERKGNWETKRFPEVFAGRTDGAWRVDSGENLFVSQEAAGGTFNHISDGDLAQIVPPGVPGGRYYPAFVIK